MTKSTQDNFWVYKAAAIAFFILVNIINIGNPILEQHSFRQTQTAISAFYLIQEGFTLNYITPVLGLSYVIPFEFPFFHFIVAFIAKSTAIPLDVVGRLVSLIFAVGVLFLNESLLKCLGVASRGRLFALLLAVFSPVFLFWSGTFMIESTALFLSIASLLCAARYVKNQSGIDLFFWFGFVSLALLEKGTTALIPYLVGFAAILLTSIKILKGPLGIHSVLKMIGLILLLTVPIALGYGWVFYTDILKSENPIALSKLTSSALGAWNYGVPTQRFSYDFWIKDIFLRGVAPSALLGLGLIALFYCIYSKSIKKADGYIALGFLGLYLTPQLIFTNLFIVHNYYHYAVIIYLCNAVAIAYGDIEVRAKKVATYLLLATCVCSLVFFSKEYRNAKFKRIDKSHITIALANQIQFETLPEDVFVLLGNDWSAEVAYYTQRKSLTVPDWYLNKLNTEDWALYLNKSPKMIVICNNNDHRYDAFINHMNGYGLNKEIQGCSLFKQRAL